MHRGLLVAAVTLATAGLPAQEKTQEELKAQRAEKLAKEVFDRAPWIRDYDRARAAAKQQGRFLLVYFTRSFAP